MSDVAAAQGMLPDSLSIQADFTYGSGGTSEAAIGPVAVVVSGRPGPRGSVWPDRPACAWTTGRDAARQGTGEERPAGAGHSRDGRAPAAAVVGLGHSVGEE